MDKYRPVGCRIAGAIVETLAETFKPRMAHQGVAAILIRLTHSTTERPIDTFNLHQMQRLTHLSQLEKTISKVPLSYREPQTEFQTSAQMALPSFKMKSSIKPSSLESKSSSHLKFPH
jgi:hypothetical protein